MTNEERKFVDLHVHTIYSDGTCTPQEVVDKANELNLKAIAITDHDCIDGIRPAIEAAKDSGLEIVPGVEISSSKDDVDIHMLGYFIDWNNADLQEELRRIRKRRRGNN